MVEDREVLLVAELGDAFPKNVEDGTEQSQFTAPMRVTGAAAATTGNKSRHAAKA